MLWSVLFVVVALWLVKLVPTAAVIAVLIMMGVAAVVEEGIKLTPRITPYVRE